MVEKPSRSYCWNSIIEAGKPLNIENSDWIIESGNQVTVGQALNRRNIENIAYNLKMKDFIDLHLGTWNKSKVLQNFTQKDVAELVTKPFS